jgi:hypothetical protein
VYRSDIPKSKIDEALAYLDQAEDYFNAGNQGRINVRPVLLYYSMLNLAKCLLIARNPSLAMEQARHGLITIPQGRAILGDRIAIKNSAKYVNVFGELVAALEGKGLSLRDLQVGHILPQILPGHRLWSYASHKTEQFISVSDIRCLVDHNQHHAWLVVLLNKGEAHHISKTVARLLSGAHLPGSWSQVRSDDAQLIALAVCSGQDLNKSNEFWKRATPLPCVIGGRHAG